MTAKRRYPYDPDTPLKAFVLTGNDLFNDRVLTPQMELELFLREGGSDNVMDPEQELQFDGEVSE